MITNKVSIDTNILLYFLDISNENKRNIAADILLKSPNFNSQSLSEVINVLGKRWKYPKEKIINVIENFLVVCNYTPVNASTLKLAFDLIEAYNFQIFDSVIVASALESNCNILYSEDFQNGLIVEKQLTIINPFV